MKYLQFKHPLLGWWLALGLALIILVIVAWPLWQRLRQEQAWLKPYLVDAHNSRGATNPLVAYQLFWQALQDNQRELALSYIIGRRRDYYQQAWQNNQHWLADQALPAEVELLWQEPCSAEAIACQQRAILSYSTATDQGQIEMYQNLAGAWQVGFIY